jgi:hypothetical protein
MQIQTVDGRTILTLREWRAMLVESGDGVLRYLDGVRELAHTWCLGGSLGIPDEVAALLRSRLQDVSIEQVTASAGLRRATREPDLTLHARFSGGSIVGVVVPTMAIAQTDLGAVSSAVLRDAAQGAVAKAAETGASAAALILHEISTHLTSSDRLMLGRAHVRAFAHELRVEPAPSGVLTGPVSLPTREGQPTVPFWFGVAARQIPVVPWIA